MSDSALFFISIIHLFVALFLIVFVLLQDSKGGAMGMLGGGGGSNTLFGATGATNFLVKITRWTAIIFACTCIALTYITTQKSTSVLDSALPAEGTQPLDTAPAASAAPAPTAEDNKENKEQ